MKKAIAIIGLAVSLLLPSGCSLERQTKSPSYRTVIDYQYENIVLNESIITVQQDGLWGAYFKEGEDWELSLPVQYKNIIIQDDSQGNRWLIVIQQDDTVQILRSDGSALTEESYSGAELTVNDTFCVLSKEGCYGVLSQDGDWLLPPVYSEITEGKGYYQVYKDHVFDWLDLKGNHLLPDSISPQSIQRMFCYSINGNIFSVISFSWENQTGVLDAKGNYILPPVYASVAIKEDLEEHPYFFCTNPDNTVDVLRENGEIVFRDVPNDCVPIGDRLFSSHTFQEGNDCWGMINEAGEIVVPANYRSMDFIGDNITATDGEGKKYLFDEKGNLLTSEGYDKFTLASDYIKVYQDDKVGVFTKEGKPLIPTEYESIGDVSLQLQRVWAKKEGKWGVVDLQNHPVIEFDYSNHGLFDSSTGYTFAAKEGKAGILNQDGTVIIPFLFDGPDKGMPFRLNGNLAVAAKDGKYGCIEMVP